MSALVGSCGSSPGLGRRLNWYEMTLQDAKDGVRIPRSIDDGYVFSNQGLVQVAREASSSKGVATTTEGMMGLETYFGGGGVKSTSLTKREC